MEPSIKNLHLSKNINRFKEKYRYTFKEMSLMSGVPVQTIAGWSCGNKPRNVDDVRKLAKVFRVSLYFLLYGEVDPFQESVIKDQDAKNVLRTLAKYLKKIE